MGIFVLQFYFFSVLEAKKPLIVVVNENLMDNHQTELAEKLGGNGYLEYCLCSTLHSTIKNFDASKIKPFPPGNLNSFSNHIDSLFCKQNSIKDIPAKKNLTNSNLTKTSSMRNDEADYQR